MQAYISNASEHTLMITDRGVYLVDENGGGVLDSVMKLRPGEVQRWRIINAAITMDSFYQLNLDSPDIELYQIAFDGLTLDRRIRLDTLGEAPLWLNPAALSPGNRMDVMVRAPKTAKNGSRALSVVRELFNYVDFTKGPEDTNPLEIRVEISGDAVDSEWSEDESLPGCGLAAFDDSELATREIKFGPGNTIGGEAYSGKVRHQMELGTAEEWTIKNHSQGRHPYHIHVNPFFITHVNGEKLPEGSPMRRWQDTVALPVGSQGDPGSITFKTRFEKFRGKFVIHCHILRHEDLGMMQRVEVI